MDTRGDFCRSLNRFHSTMYVILFFISISIELFYFDNYLFLISQNHFVSCFYWFKNVHIKRNKYFKTFETWDTSNETKCDWREKIFNCTIHVTCRDDISLEIAEISLFNGLWFASKRKVNSDCYYIELCYWQLGNTH